MHKYQNALGDKINRFSATEGRPDLETRLLLCQVAPV